MPTQTNYIQLICTPFGFYLHRTLMQNPATSYLPNPAKMLFSQLTSAIFPHQFHIRLLALREIMHKTEDT